MTALAMCLNTFFAAPFIALVPAMALKVLHSGSGGTAVLITAQGVGAVLMAFSLGTLVGRYGSRRVLTTLMSLLPIALVAYASAPDLALSALALFAVGLLYLGALSSFTTIAQLRVTHRDQRSRARGLHGDPRVALPARIDHPGQDRRPHRPPRDDDREPRR